MVYSQSFPLFFRFGGLRGYLRSGLASGVSEDQTLVAWVFYLVLDECALRYCFLYISLMLRLGQVLDLVALLFIMLVMVEVPLWLDLVPLSLAGFDASY
ncbi:unnamed protein product [Arabis nemorensis]|uniref:Transmembrane protein n=1 Tax=Arabis nemorensis TaxID=586526 RepID=A0A565BDI3_9BRAS|nr:unnamed protein product [Arabis nemorensis]